MSESNNRLPNREEEEKKGKVTNTVLGATGVALGAVAAGTEAQAKEVLLCSYLQPEVSVGSFVNDPESASDQNPVPNDFLDFGTSQYVYKGYVIKPMDEGVSTDWHVFKKVNGQDVQVGQLDGMSGQFLAFITDSGVALSGGKLYKVTDTGATLVSEYVGDMPQGGKITHFGGYIFASYAEDNNHVTLIAVSEADVLSHTGDEPIPIASTREISADSSAKYSKGIDADRSTNELVISLKQGAMTIDLTQFLDENVQLSPDFSLADVTLGKLQSLPLETVGTIASNGYKYHLVKGGENIIMQAPTGEPVVISKNQLGAGAKIKSLNELNNGGIYILFEDVSDSPSQTPVVLHESGEITQDPGEMPPYIKHCFVVAPEDQYLFEPAADPCAEDESICDDTNPCTTDTCTNDNGQAVCDNIPSAGQTCDDEAKCTTNDKCDLDGDCAGTPKTCEQPANQCEQSAGCNQNTGNCQTENKTDGTLCNDNDQSTENDQCVSGACQGTPIVNPEPNPEPEPDVIELNPEKADVVEQDEIAGDTDDVAEDEDIANDTADTTTDATADTAADQSNDNATPETTNPEQSVDVFEDALYVEGEGEDTVSETDTSPETAAEEISADIYAETQEVIAAEKDHPKKSPGCGCTTTGVSPDSMDGTLLLGAMLIGLAANMRYKILSALAKRK